MCLFIYFYFKTLQLLLDIKMGQKYEQEMQVQRNIVMSKFLLVYEE